MAAVQQRILNWLYSVLTSEYQDVNRTYSDVAQALSYYSSLAPKTEVYTYDNGTSALLLQLSGTLPVVFRGTTYRFPISLWIPHEYPREPPIVYATPVEGMMIRAGQHVDPQGRVYHPYLVAWAQYWDKSNILDFLAILRDVFAKEPPVVARQQYGRPPISAQSVTTPPPVPPLPREIVGSPGNLSKSDVPVGHPPPPPPKGTIVSHSQTSGSILAGERTSGPPLPPLPAGRTYGQAQLSHAPYSNPQQTVNPLPVQQNSLRYENPPPLPSHIPGEQNQRASIYNPQVSVPLYRPEGQVPLSPETRSSGVGYHQGQGPINGALSPYRSPQAFLQSPLPWQQTPHATPQAKAKPAPPPDLLDEPLAAPLPSESQTPLPAPPVPPNPEKDLLLHQLAHALQAQRQESIMQVRTSMPGLQAQRDALVSALTTMQAEMSSLTSLGQTLTSNSSILQSSLVKADQTIQDSQHKAPPGIDEILVAPTVVGNQLYELVSEERALGDALFVLGRAVERGRVTAPVFVKITRGMAREWFLKKALAKKIGKGMGLDSAHGLGY